MKRISVFLMVLILTAGLLCGNTLTAQAAELTEPSGQVEVTRLEWLKALTEVFQMQVDEENYPDNYYSDVDASSEDYYDIMLATEFGLVDVEAGDALRPEEAATREFAVHSLNVCMGYLLEEGAEYTFSEANEVNYPNDIQIAVNKGWLELSDKDFLPEQGITTAEKDKMIAEAEAVVASTAIDADYESQYQFAEGVIVIPETTEVLLSDENELTLYDCTVEIAAGDVFVVFSEGFPVARKAVTVAESSENELVITVESVDLEEAFTELEVQGTINADLAQIQAADDTVQLAYIVGGTAEQGYEDGVTFYSLREVEEEEITAVIATKTIQPQSKMRAATDPFTISCKITNVSADYGASILKQEAFVKISGDVSVSFNAQFMDIPLSSDFVDSFVKIPIGVIGYFKPEVEGKISGNASLGMQGSLTVGVQWTGKEGVRLIGNFKKKAFTLQIEVEGKIGLKASIGVDVGFLDASLYAETGAKAAASVATYLDNKLPQKCTHLTAHLYASVGGAIEFKLIIFKTEVSLEKEIYDEKNSPVKIVLHYEDGKYVSECSRDIEEDEGSDGGSTGGSTGGSGSVSTKKYNYYTPINSQYAYTGANTGISSTGEEFSIFEYKLDDSKQATIKKYNGNVAVLNIPQTIDGYTVVGIGSEVFKNNKRLMVVNIPDTVTSIGVYAFSGCSNLSDIKLSKSLESIGYYAFYDCDSLTSIEIPKSLDSTSSLGNQKGPFSGCDNLKTIRFETGTTQVASNLFANCTSLEKITIPDTVTTIETNAFANCVNLKTINWSSSLTQIDSSAFAGCSALEQINLPDTVIKIGTRAFENCINLSNVTLSKSLESMGYYAFLDCDSLTSIEIPKSLDSTSSLGNDRGVFSECDNLKTVKFEAGTTQVASNLFAKCPGLEEITIPDTVTIIEAYAFADCVNLKEINWSSSLTQINGNAFEGCIALEQVHMPNTVTSMGIRVFENCMNLSDVKLSKALTDMGYYAFSNCDKITSIEIPKSLDSTSSLGNDRGVFSGCDNLKTVKFEAGTTQVASNLFAKCPGLEAITIPDTVTVIEAYAFADCSNLKEINWSSALTQINGNAFEGCSALEKVNIPDTVTNMGNSVFKNCVNLSDVTLSKTLVSMGYYVFLDCDSLTSIEIPKSLDSTSSLGNDRGVFSGCDNLKTVKFEEGTTQVASNIFAKCTGLEEITIPDTVTVIESYAFTDCANLKEVVMPTALAEIKGCAFEGCSALEEISIPDTVTSMGSNLFTDCTSLKNAKLSNACTTIPDDMFRNCTALTTIEIPDTVTKISEYAFQNAGLTAIELPEKLTTIENYVFNNCDALQAISIPDSVTSIGTYCFADCEVLSDVSLGSGLTKLNSYTFNLCPSLQKLVLPYRMSTVAANAFTNCTKLTELTVPRATISIATNACSYPTKMTVYGVAGTYAEEWADSVGASFVNQEKPATAVTLNEATLTINKGKTANLVMSVTPTDFTDAITWKSNNESVATVSDAGVVTAKSVGNATIRVTVGNISASCKVTVVQPVTGISLNKTSLSLEDEAVYTLTANVNPSTANDRSVTWSSSDETVATVDQSGNVTALKKGTAVITVTANDGSGISKSCTVTVTNNYYRCTNIGEMESVHNYENDCNDVWIYTLPGVERLAVTFDERTCVEDEFDYLYVYDAAGNEVGQYTGVALAGQTIVMDGDTIKIKLSSDNAGNDWGFKVTRAEEYCEHTFETTWSSDDTHHWHAATCGHGDVTLGKEEHTSSDWILDKEATTEEAGSRHKECLVCTRVLATEVLDKLVDPAEELAERLDTAVNQAVEAAAGLTEENIQNATEDEKKQAVATVLEQIGTACEAQDIAELGILPAESAIEIVSRMTVVEDNIKNLLGTSVTVEAKEGQQDMELPTVQNALLSVSDGDNATIQVEKVDAPMIPDVDTANTVAFTMELFNKADEKLELKVPVIVILPIPAGIDMEKDVVIYHFHDNSTEVTEKIQVKVNKDDNTITFVTGSFSTFVVANASEGVEISGTVSSDTSDSTLDNTTTIKLLDANNAEIAQTTVTTNSGSYTLSDIPAGTYTLQVSKEDHVTREYTVEVGTEVVTLNVEIWLRGDVNGDGDVNAKDKKRIFNHIEGNALTDYAFVVGNVDGRGDIDAKDKKMIYNHIEGNSLLW